jgi:hypothetical protein
MRRANEEIQDFRRYFTGLPRRGQAVEKVVVGPAGSSKTGSNTTKTGLKHLRNGVLGL